MRRPSLVRPSLVLALLAGWLVVPGVAAAPAAAQDWRPEAGDRALAFAVPTFSSRLPTVSSGGVELWWQRSDRSALGLSLEMGFGANTATDGTRPDRTSRGASFSIGPALKRYGDPVGPVSPFLYGALGFGGSRSTLSIDDADTPDRSRWRANASGRVGIGVDWFPVERISIGGHTGGSVGYGILGQSDDPDASRRSWSVGLFTSSLRIQLHF